jgi:hypothetical protein
MKQTVIILLFLTALHTAVSAQSTKVTSTLQHFRDDFTKSMINGDVSFKNYTDVNIRLMPEYSMTVMTQSESARYYEAFHKHFDVTAFNRIPSETLDMGTRIAEWGLFNMTIVHRESNKTYEVPGKYMDIWSNDASGKMLLLTQAWNYNRPIDFADKLKFTEVRTTNIALSAHSPTTDAVSFELAGMNELMESTIIQHDARQWKMFYSDDGNFLYSNTPVSLGRDALDKFLDEHVATLPIFEKLDIRNDQVVNLGNYIIEYASHTAFVRGENWSGTGTGKDIRIWKRGSDCSLKIFRHIGMYD